MAQSFKKEFIFGLTSILILSAILIFHTIRYERQAASLTTVSTTTSLNPATILTSEEISKHSSPNDCWLVIQNKVYVASDFLLRHPGGGGLITPYCSKDATQVFLSKDGKGTHSAEAFRILGLIYIGDVNGKVVKQIDKNAVKSIPIKKGDGDDN